MAEVPLFGHEVDFLIRFHVGERSFLPVNKAKLGVWEWKHEWKDKGSQGLLPVYNFEFPH